jgi:hypothetical protein
MARGFICDICASVVAGDTTVGNLIKDGDALQKEGLRKNEKMLIQALGKYQMAWKALKESGGHADCVDCVNNEYKQLYRSLQGSRV